METCNVISDKSTHLIYAAMYSIFLTILGRFQIIYVPKICEAFKRLLPSVL